MAVVLTMVEKVRKTEAEWQAQLTPEQFQVTRKKGTERMSDPFALPYPWQTGT